MKDAARTALAGFVALAIIPGATGIIANPSGEIVVHGDITFDRSVPGHLSVFQGGQRGIIHWNDFSIAAGEFTRFNQPGPNAATLNRVVSSLSSRIDGRLSANGQVFLINPNGIVVGPSGRVDTAGFVASTLDVPDSAFLAGGDLRFSGDSRAAVVNHGAIRAIGGDVFLLGARVANHGRILAPSGTVGLGAGQDILLRQAGSDERLFVKPSGGNRGGTGVDNTGTIEAARAELKAHGNVYALAINNSGMIRASGAARKNGRVLLGAPGGKIFHSGKVSARNADGSGGEVRIDTTPGGEIVAAGSIDAGGRPGSGTPGGDVIMAASRIELNGAASVDVSGDSGGGMIRIGGGPQGRDPSIENASEVIVGRGVHLSADARRSGDGGTVIVWSDGATTFDGRISARALGGSGNGGFAEVSGLRSLDYRGFTDLRSASGETGTLLLDPTDATIDGPAATNIEAALGGAHVVFSTNPAGGQPGNVAVTAPINSNSPNTLGIFAHGDIGVNAAINLPNGALALIGGWDGVTENPGLPGIQPVGGINLANFVANPASYGNNSHGVTINTDVQANFLAIAGDGITQNANLTGGSTVALAHRQPYNQIGGQLTTPQLQLFDTGDFGAMIDVNQVQFAKTGGNVNVVNQNAVNLGGNFNSPGGFLFQNLAGNVFLDPGLNLVSGGLPPVTIAAGQNLINNAGPGVFGGSNFAIYSQGPAGDVDGGLLGFAVQQFNSPFPTPPLNPQSFLYPGPAPVVPGPGGGNNNNNRPGGGGNINRLPGGRAGPVAGPGEQPDVVTIAADPGGFLFPNLTDLFDPTYAQNTGRHSPILPPLGFSSSDPTRRLGLLGIAGFRIPFPEAESDLSGFGDHLIFGRNPRTVVSVPSSTVELLPSSGYPFSPAGGEESRPAAGDEPDTRSELQREMDIRRKLRTGDNDGIREAASHLRGKYLDNPGPQLGESVISWIGGFDEFADALDDFFIRKEADIKRRLREGDPTAPGDAIAHLRQKYGNRTGTDRSGHDWIADSNEFGDAFAEWKRKEFQRIVELLEAGDPEGIADALRYLRFTGQTPRSGRLGDEPTSRDRLLDSPFGEAVRAFEEKEEERIKQRLAEGDVSAVEEAVRLIRWRRPRTAEWKSDYDLVEGSEEFGDLIRALDRDDVEEALRQARLKAEAAFLRERVATRRELVGRYEGLWTEADRAAAFRGLDALEDFIRWIEDPSLPHPGNPLSTEDMERLDDEIGFLVRHYLGSPIVLPAPDDLGPADLDLERVIRTLENLPADDPLDPESAEADALRDFLQTVREVAENVRRLTADDPPVPPAVQPGADHLEKALQNLLRDPVVLPVPDDPADENEPADPEFERMMRETIDRILGSGVVPLPTPDADDPPDAPVPPAGQEAIDEAIRALGGDGEDHIGSLLDKLFGSGIIPLPTSPDAGTQPPQPPRPSEEEIRDFLETVRGAAAELGEKDKTPAPTPPKPKPLTPEEEERIQEAIRKTAELFEELAGREEGESDPVKRALEEALDDALRGLEDDPPPTDSDRRRADAALDRLYRQLFNDGILPLPGIDPGPEATDPDFERLMEDAIRLLGNLTGEAARDAAAGSDPNAPTPSEIAEFRDALEDAQRKLFQGGQIPLPTPETWQPSPSLQEAIDEAARALQDAVARGTAAGEEPGPIIDDAVVKSLNELARSGFFGGVSGLPLFDRDAHPLFDPGNEDTREVQLALNDLSGFEKDLVDPMTTVTAGQAKNAVDRYRDALRALDEALGEEPDPDDIKDRLGEGDRTVIDDLIRWWRAHPEVPAVDGWPEGFEEARKAFKDAWLEEIRRLLRAGDKRAIKEFREFLEMFEMSGVVNVGIPDSTDYWEKYGLKEDFEAFKQWWIDNIRRRLEAGDHSAIQDMLWLAELLDMSGVKNVADPDPGQSWINRTFGEALKAYRDRWRQKIIDGLLAGDPEAFKEMLRYVEFWDMSGVRNIEDADPGGKIIEDEFREALDAYIALRIPEVKEGLREGDTDAYAEAWELAVAQQPQDEAADEDDDREIDSAFQETFGGDIPLFHLMIEADIKEGLREGDPEAVKEAAEHLKFKGIDIGNTPEEQRQAILGSQEFGDAAGQFERQTGTTIDTHIPPPPEPGPPTYR